MLRRVAKLGEDGVARDGGHRPGVVQESRQALVAAAEGGVGPLRPIALERPEERPRSLLLALAATAAVSAVAVVTGTASAALRRGGCVVHLLPRRREDHCCSNEWCYRSCNIRQMMIHPMTNSYCTNHAWGRGGGVLSIVCNSVSQIER